MKWIIVPILVALLLILVVSNIVIVQQSRAYVVERLGAFRTVWNVGLHLKVPFIERVAKKVSLKEQVADFAPQPVITKDNVTMQIDTVIYFQITDPKLYTYGVEHPMNAIENLTATTLRNIIGDMELDQSLTSRDTINSRMRSILDEATDPWGIKVNRVELKNIIPPKEIQNAMEKQMKAERERRESILQAEGQKQSQILVAEGEKQSAILRADAAKQAKIMEAEAEKTAKILAAEAESEAIMKVQQATADALKLLNEAAPNDQVVKLKALETMTKVADGKAKLAEGEAALEGAAGESLERHGPTSLSLDASIIKGADRMVNPLRFKFVLSLFAGLDDAVAAAVARVDDADGVVIVRVAEDEEAVAQQVHLQNGLLHAHGLDGEALGAHDVERALLVGFELLGQLRQHSLGAQVLGKAGLVLADLALDLGRGLVDRAAHVAVRVLTYRAEQRAVGAAEHDLGDTAVLLLDGEGDRSLGLLLEKLLELADLFLGVGAEFLADFQLLARDGEFHSIQLLSWL